MDPEPSSITFSLEPADNQRLASLCGQFDEHLRQLERRLHVEISNRGNQFQIAGKDSAPRLAGAVLQDLYDATCDAPLTPERVHLHLQQAGLEVRDEEDAGQNRDLVIHTHRCT
ncbi:MAG: phosphate starvation-inducible protein PhoH, partial [Thiogranum sp.]